MAAGKKRKTPATVVKGLVLNVFLGANLATLVLLWVCCATTWVPPALHPRLSVAGLFFPAILLLNLLFVPLWLLYKPRLLLVPLVGVALCGGYVLDYFPLNFNRQATATDLTVVTWNTHALSYNSEDSVALLAPYLLEQEADVVCLQEVWGGSPKLSLLIDPLKEQGYSVEQLGGLALITRLPVLATETLHLETMMENGAMRADLLLGKDTLTVLNVHLESNSLTVDDKEQYGSVLHDPESEKVRSEARYLTGKLGNAAHYRGLQVDTLLALLESLPRERLVLVCGDFNDTPISYAYQAFSRRLANAYREGGWGVGVSFNEAYFPVRIDNIFHSRDWQCHEAWVEDRFTASDHYPVLARLKFREK